MTDYILLKRQQYEPAPVDLYSGLNVPALMSVLSLFDSRDEVSYDFETTGLSSHLDEVVSLGLSNGIHTVSIQLETRLIKLAACKWLLTKRLIGHNYIFDGLFITKYTGQVPWPYRDTLVMFKSLANEGIKGQKWTLKTAMTDVLGWPTANNDELKAYMKEHRCQFHEVDWAILGKYNGLDALATWQLWEYLETFTDQFPALTDFWDAEWCHLIALLMEQCWNGLTVDVEKYVAHDAALSKEQDEYLRLFFAVVQPHIEAYNEAVVGQIPLPKKPTKKDGSEAASMEKYRAKVEAAKLVNHFSVDSNDALCWLFYDKLQYPVAARTPAGKPSVDKKSLGKLGEAGMLLLKYRKRRDERKFIVGLLNSKIGDRVHPDIRPHGTISGRCSSGAELT
jgi:DNA polymerase I-like protein with 3'-5' exonuclease and polymerase domains